MHIPSCIWAASYLHGNCCQVEVDAAWRRWCWKLSTQRANPLWNAYKGKKAAKKRHWVLLCCGTDVWWNSSDLCCTVRLFRLLSLCESMKQWLCKPTKPASQQNNTIRRDMIWYNTAPYRTIQYRKIPNNTKPVYIIRYHTIQHHTITYNVRQYDTDMIWHDTAPNNTIQYKTIRYDTDTIWYDTSWPHTAPHNMKKYHTIQHLTIPYNVRRYDTNTIWYDNTPSIPYNVRQYDTIRYDTIRYDTTLPHIALYCIVKYLTKQN